MRKLWIAILMMVPCMFARGDDRNCKEVSGGIVTNVLNESGTVNFGTESGKPFVATSLGTATGDLKGALVVAGPNICVPDDGQPGHGCNGACADRAIVNAKIGAS